MRADRLRWHLFCSVIDNLGDAGVLWRLARDLAGRGRFDVTLSIDNLAVLAQIEPRVSVTAPTQRVAGVTIVPWQALSNSTLSAEVVVEGFGCELPGACLEAMARARPAPAWIHLDYLSAEEWVERFHGQPSPHPRLPLTKHFFFPGFTAASGGLLREPDLIVRRDAWRADAARQAASWRQVGLGPPGPGESRMSLFAYAHDRLAGLFTHLASGACGRWTVLVPEGVLAREIDTYLGEPLAPLGQSSRREALELRRVPFLDQDAYDELLWGCDVNWVRGEDSFVRAQWAGQGMVWQIYPQAEAAHRIKLSAFLERYLAGWPDAEARLTRALWQAWNEPGADVGGAFGPWWAQRERWRPLVRCWPKRLAEQRDLTGRVVDFACNVLKLKAF